MRQLECAVCGKFFEHWQWKAKFCSKKCQHKSEYKKYQRKYLDREYQLQKAYGLSLSAYEAMKVGQNYQCRICKNTPAKLS